MASSARTQSDFGPEFAANSYTSPLTRSRAAAAEEDAPENDLALHSLLSAFSFNQVAETSPPSASVVIRGTPRRQPDCVPSLWRDEPERQAYAPSLI